MVRTSGNLNHSTFRGSATTCTRLSLRQCSQCFPQDCIHNNDVTPKCLNQRDEERKDRNGSLLQCLARIDHEITHLPELGSNLVTALAGLNVNNLSSHGCKVYLTTIEAQGRLS